MESTGRWRLGASVVLCGALVSGCGHGAAGVRDSGTTGHGETAVPATMPAKTTGASPAGGAGDGTAIHDDFSDPSSGWTRRATGPRTADYVDGAYVLSADNDADEYVGSEGRYEAHEFTNTRFEVKATKLSGPDGSPIGLSCRQFDEGEHRGVYFADVDGEGEARLGLYADGDQKILSSIERPGLWREGANSLRLDCIGNDLRFFVDGDEVLSARDGRFDHGVVGVSAGGAGSGVTRVSFDDAVITIIK
jgi:hypothetical protein